MKILHTITCTRFAPFYNAREEFTRHLTRRRRLTLAGCERILQAKEREDNGGKNPEHLIHVTRLETAIYQ